jgi:hypothetical protein
MLLREDILVKPILEEMDSGKLPDGVLCRVKYPVCRIGERNANNRIYEKDVWEKVLADDGLIEKLNQRGLFGHAEHPEATQSDLQLTSHVINKMWVDENVMFQEFDVLDTPTGKIVDCLLRAGCMVGCSTRAEGDLEESEDDKGPYSKVLSDSYHYVTTDFTADPSTFGVVPQDIRRNVVSEIKVLRESKEAGEVKFAEAMLASMQCKDKSKCQHCGCCDEKKEAEDEHMTLEQMITKDLVKLGALVEYKGKKREITAINEGMVDILVDDKAVSIDGAKYVWLDNAGTITIEPREDMEIPEPAPEVLPDEPVDVVPDEDIELQEPVGDVIPEENFEVDMPVESKDGKVKGKIAEINEDTVVITAEDGTSVSLNTGEIRITLPVPTEEVPVEAEAVVCDGDIEGEIPESVDEAKMGVDYMKDVKAAIKKAAQALKDKDYEAAAAALDSVADDATDAAKAAKKMKRAADAKAEEEEAKEAAKEEDEVKEDVVDEEVVVENVDCRHCGASYEVKNKEDYADSYCPHCEKKQSEKKVDEDFEKFEGKGIEIGDSIQIMDLEGNTTPVPKATVAKIEEVQDGVMSVEVTGSDNEDEQQWYNEDEYQIILLKKAVESKEVNEDESDDLVSILSTKEGWAVAEQAKRIFENPTAEGIEDAELNANAVKYIYRFLKTRNESLAVEAREAIEDWVDRDWGDPAVLESKSTESIAKEIMDLRIAEASAKAERDKVLEELENISSGKIFQTKILVNKLKEVTKREASLTSALRTKLEEKAKEVNKLSEKNETLKANFIKSINEIKARIVEAGKSKAEDTKTLNENHQLEVTKIKKGAEQAVKNITDSFIKQYVKIRISESGLTLDNNSQALLESRKTLEEVDNTLDEIRDIKRRGALHSELVEQVVVEKVVRVDEEQEEVNRKVGNVLKGFSL